MEAGGVASKKSDAQYASKDDAYEKQCDLLKEVSCKSKGVCGNKVGVAYKRGPWTKVEDGILRKVVEEFGPNDWVKIEMQSGLDRTSKSCRLRWKNHLQPNLKKGSFSSKEERDVIMMHYRYGNKWSLMAKRLPGRSDNEIKNMWHSRIKKCKKRGTPLYPEWCLEEDRTSNDDEGYMKSDGKKMVAPESSALGADQKTQSHSYYNPVASIIEPLIKASPSIMLPETEFWFLQDNAQTTLHHEDHHELSNSFQNFLSPRPKTSLSFPSTLSTSVSSTPHQQQYRKMGNFNNVPTFDTFQCPPLVSSQSGRFKRLPGAILPPLMKPLDALAGTKMSPLRLTMSSSNEDILDNSAHLLDALPQDAQVDSCLSDIQFVEQCLFSQQFNTPHHLYDKILRRKEYYISREASLGRNLRSGVVSSNGSLLQSKGILGKSQQMRESSQSKELEASGGAVTSGFLGCERLSNPFLKRKERIGFEDDKCDSRIPTIKNDQASLEDLASYSFDFPLDDTTSETLSLDGICESNLFHGYYSAPDLIEYNQNEVLCGSTELLDEHSEIQDPSNISLSESNKFEKARDIDMEGYLGEYSFEAIDQSLI